MIDAIEYHTKHFNARPLDITIDAIVIHDTGGKTAESTLRWFEDDNSKVSSHYLIDRDGTIYECVPVDYRAWHAGMSALFGREDVNDFSIGIELVDNNDDDAYPAAQIDALFNVCTDLCFQYRIPLHRVVGHCHVAPERKKDPGKDFPWYEFLNTLGSNLIQKELEFNDPDT